MAEATSYSLNFYYQTIEPVACVNILFDPTCFSTIQRVFKESGVFSVSNSLPNRSITYHHKVRNCQAIVGHITPSALKKRDDKLLIPGIGDRIVTLHFSNSLQLKIKVPQDRLAPLLADYNQKEEEEPRLLELSDSKTTTILFNPSRIDMIEVVEIMQ